MPLDFILLSVLALAFYGFTYFILRRRIMPLSTFLAELREQQKESTRSFLMSWILRGRGAADDRLMHLFSIFPPLMAIVTAVGMIFVFLTAIAFLRINTSIGALVAALMLVFPFYRAADAFDMYIMSNVANHAGVSNLSADDASLLDAAIDIITWGAKYFGKLSALILLILPFDLAFDPIASGFLSSLYPHFAQGLLSFLVLALAILFGTVTTPKLSQGSIMPDSDQTHEVGLPLYGNHLSYGSVPTFDATRRRLMKKFRISESIEKAKGTEPSETA
jgi:hypothetical protein